MRCKSLQDFDADVVFGEMLFWCTPIVVSKLDKPWVNYVAIAPVEPSMTSLSQYGGRSLFIPNPLSYHPQWTFRTTTQGMVRSRWEMLSCARASVLPPLVLNTCR